MDYVIKIKTIVLVLGIQLGLGMIGYSWLKGRRTPLLYSFIGYQILLTLWFSSQTLRIFAGRPVVEWCLSRLEYFAVSLLGWAWLYFCLLYGDHKFSQIKWKLVWLSLIPAPSYIFLGQWIWVGWSGDVSVRYWAKNGLDFPVLQSYFFLGVGTFVLIRYFFHQYGGCLKQISLLVLALLLPYVVNGVLTVGRIQTGFGSFPASFMVSLGLCFSLAFKDKLLDLKPLAWQQIFVEMQEKILIVDNFNRIIGSNFSLREVLPQWDTVNPGDLISLMGLLEQVGESTPKLQTLLKVLENGNEEPFRTEIKLPGPDECWMAVKVRSFWSGQVRLGRIISLTDISKRRRIVADSHRRIHQLAAMNRKLREHAAAVEESAIIQERNRFARDLHDTAGQTMNLLTTLLQIGIIYCRKDPSVTERKLTEAMGLVEEGLREVRRSLVGLSIIQSNSNNLIIAIKNLLVSYESAGLQGDLKVEGCSDGLSIKRTDVIYRLIQEALTNAVRHGKAQHIEVQLIFTPEKVRISIKDDGCGSPELSKKGMGLTGMEARVQALNGRFVINSHPGQGFRIEVELPEVFRESVADDEDAPLGI